MKNIRYITITVVCFAPYFLSSCDRYRDHSSTPENYSASSDTIGHDATSLAGIISDQASDEDHVVPGLLEEISDFLEIHREFGVATQAQAMPDWAHGKRQRVQFSNGRNLLFYMKADEVITIYEDIPNQGRKKIWGEYN